MHFQPRQILHPVILGYKHLGWGKEKEERRKRTMTKDKDIRTRLDRSLSRRPHRMKLRQALHPGRSCAGRLVHHP